MIMSWWITARKGRMLVEMVTISVSILAPRINCKIKSSIVSLAQISNVEHGLDGPIAPLHKALAWDRESNNMEYLFR